MSSTFLGFSTTPASNTAVNGIGIQGTNAVQNFDNALRELLAIYRRDIDGRVVLSTKGAGYTAVANDNNAVIRFSAAATLSLTAAATLGSGWHCWVMADGGAVVIDPNASETINGATTITIPDGYSTLVICDGTNFRASEDYATVSAALSSLTSSLASKQDNSGELYRGLINGLTLTNNGTDATNDIDIATGSAGSDGTTPILMTLESALTKRLDASWAVGSGNGGLDTGSVANATYHVWLIRRSDTGVEDALFSLSSSSPTMPTNYDQKRRIGYVVRASATNGVPVNVNKPNIEFAGAAPGTLCRAHVRFNGTGTLAIIGSFNVSSVTDNGTGDYTVNFTTAMADANYSFTTTIAGSAGTSQTHGQVSATAPTTTALRVFSSQVGVGATDVSGYCVTVY